jgi:RHS repeat-associated protein
MRLFDCRTILLVAAALAAGCDANLDAGEPVAVTKRSPSTVSTADAWRLFDRSIASQFTPGRERITLGLDPPSQLRAFKIFGPAPYHMEIRGAGGSSLGFPSIDMSSLSPGWHVVTSSAATTAAQVELRFESTGAAGGVPELELWAEDDSPATARGVDLAARELPAGLTSISAEPSTAELSAGDCVGFATTAGRSPALLRSAHLVYDASGLFRPFAVVRSVNGLGTQGGQWLTGDGDRRGVVDEIDPAHLRLGVNEVTLCAPDAATGRVSISNLRLVGELDTGAGQARAVTVGDARRDGSAALDGNPATTVEVAAGERIEVSFDRLISPDAVVLTGRANGAAAIECVDRAGARRAIDAHDRATATGKLIALEAGGLACAAIVATFDRGATLGELDVVGSGAAEPVDWPRIVVTSAPEHFGATAWVGGFVARPAAMTGAIRVEVAGETSAALTGDFGALLTRGDAAGAPWPVAIVAHLPDGTTRERRLVLDRDHAAQLAQARSQPTPASLASGGDDLFGRVGQSVAVLVPTTTFTKVRLGTRVGVDIPAGALSQPTSITISHLAGTTLPPLDPGMVNVTAPKGDAYEFLPHEQFGKAVEVIVPFDPALLPDGRTAGDVQTFFFDPTTETWKALPPPAIDLADSTAHSATNHFTIMINAVLAVPTDPKPLSFDPAALSSIGAASPGAGIDLIEPPQPSPTGEARVALPIEVPTGRGAYTPSLAISYASTSGNSWLGVGWDLHLSRIEIDTRWGAATYADGDGVRYAFDSSELVPTLDDDGPSCSEGATARRYHARIEGGFAHILRCGDEPSSYHWEVHDRNGTLLVFGASATARLASYETAHSHGGIFRWGLERVVDVHGNTTQFHYTVDDDTDSAEPSRELYPAAIDYTTTGALASVYSIVFDLDDGTRRDRIVSGRAGFKVVTRHLLRAVHVKFHDQVIRDYVLSYAHGQFDKSVLASVKVFGIAGCAAGNDAFAEPTCPGAAFLDQHTFDYFQDSQGFADPQTWQVASDPDASAAALGKGATAAVSGGAGVTIGASDLSATVGVNGSYAGRKELVGLYDMNGDGLPDEVFDTSGAGFLDQLLGDTDGSITVLYNQSRAGLDPASDALFSPGAAVHGLGALGGDRQTSWGLTLSGKADIVQGSVGFSESTARARRLLADLDGDGFTDLVNADGDSLLSAPCPGGVCFATAPFGATHAVDPRNDPLLQGFAADIRSRTFMGDPVVQWIAPFDGVVTVSGIAHKLRAGGADGVTVEVYHQDSLLASHGFAPGDTGSVVFPAETPVPVAAGEAIYVRVKTGDDDGIAPDGSLLDLVDERLTIAYASACTAVGCGEVLDPGVMKEPTGRPVFAYDSRDDFRVANAPSPLVVLAGGTLALHAQLTKQVSLANLRVCVQQFAAVHKLATRSLDRPCATSDADVSNLSGTQAVLAGSAVPLALDVTAAVEPGQLIVVRVESDLAFDPTAVSLQPSGTGPIATYTEVCLPNLAGTGSDCSTDPSVIASVPLPLAGFSAFTAVPSLPAAIPFVAPGDGELAMTSFAAPSGPYVFAVRSDRHGVISEIDCPSGSCGSTIGVAPFTVSGDESVTFELVTPQGAGGPSTIQASFPGSTQTIPLAHRPFAPAPLATPFGGGFRGFRAAFWNEAEAFAPTQLLADLEAQLLVTQDRRQQIARSIVPPIAAPGGTELTGGAPAWLGPLSAAFVAASGLHASAIGGSAGAGTAGDRGGVFDGRYARLSGTQSLFIAVGLVNVPGFSFDLQASKSSTDTTTDAVDMNGDGVLDVVTPRTTTLGALTAAAGGAGTAGFEFGDQLRHRAGHEYEVGFGGKAVVRRTTSAGRTLDVGNSDGPDTGFLGLSAGRGLGLGRSQTTRDLIDLNGDGLPDLVERAGATIRVRLNLGDRFGAAEAFGQLQDALLGSQDSFEDHVERNAQALFDSTSDALQHETTITTDESGGFDFIVVSCTHSSKHSSSRITRQLADINGDGLPDLLYKKHGDDHIAVQLNRGGDFGPVVSWSTTDGWPVNLGAQLSDVAGELLSKLADLAVTGPDVLAGTGSQESTSNGCSVSIPIFPGVSLDFSASESGDKDTYELSLIDIDGDGAADHVLRKGHPGDPGTVYVKHNLVTGKANLLSTIHRPLGGTIALDYARTANSVALPHSFEVLSRIVVDDGVDLGPSFASPDLVTDVSYADGFYDRHEKEFLGFAKVTTRRGDGVTAEEDFNNTSYALHGLVARDSRRDADGNRFEQYDISYAVVDVVGPDGAPLAADPQCAAHLPTLLAGVPDACTPRFPIIVEANDARYEGGEAHKTHRVVTAAADRDRFGNQLVTTDFGDDAIASDDTYSRAIYRNDVATWILGRPTSLQVRAGSANGALLRSRSGDYDALGELIALHGDTGAGIATTTLGYDAYGNIVHVETPPNEAGQPQTYDVAYDAETASHPVRTSDGFGLVSTASYDLRFGIATSEIDVNQVELRRTLDAFGRITSVSGPYDTTTPGLTMEYHPEDSPPRAVTTMHPAAPADYTGPVPAPITTVAICDGLERTIELRKTAVVDGVAGVTTSGLVARDTAGRVVKTQNPFFTAGASTSFIAPQVTLATAIAYDALDRGVSTQYPDGVVETARFDIAAAANGTVLFQQRMIDANGHARETYLDHAGLTRALVEHAGATDALVTSYDYLATGELSHIAGPDGVQTSLGYDLLGRRTSLDNPDSGLTTYQYDLMGNRIAVVEPNHRALGTQVHYLFDRDRIAAIDYPSKPDVTYSYGAPGAAGFSAGRVAQVSDETGAQQHSYGALGELRRKVRSFHDPGHQVGDAVFDERFTTDSFGRLLRVAYPDGEVVTNTFDAAGQLAQVDGAGSGWSRSYASAMRYDVFGNRTRIQLGNGDTSVLTFDPARVRLTSLVTTLASSTKVQDLHYTYDPVGNPTKIDNNLPPTPVNNTLPGTASQALSYDGVDRLVHATGSGTQGSNKTTTYDLTFGYSAADSLLRKTSVHQVINHSGTVNLPHDTNYDASYSYGAARPHLPTQIGSLVLAYDASGNPTSRTDGGVVQQLIWDDDNRLVQVQGAGANQRNLFDADGLRVLRHGRGNTIFASAYFEYDNAATGTKHVFAGASHVATVLAHFTSGANPSPPTKQGTPFYLHDNHLGSTAVVTTAGGDVNDAHEYFPDGAAWIESGHGGTVDGFLFEGKPLDPDTGFYNFGQRFYDPKTSIWLGVDAKLTDDTSRVVGKRAGLAPIAFSANNPLRFVDPDGRDVGEFFSMLGHYGWGVVKGATYPIRHPIKTAVGIVTGAKAVVELAAETASDAVILIDGDKYERQYVADKVERVAERFDTYITTRTPEQVLEDFGEFVGGFVGPSVAGKLGGAAKARLGARAASSKLGRLTELGDEAAELRPYEGPGGGHHVPAKKAFEGAKNYDLKKALAIPNAELKRLRVKHKLITPAQQRGYRALAKSGQPLTWEAMADIETNALIAGGMRANMARATVNKAIQALKDAGVEGPVRIPWGD